MKSRVLCTFILLLCAAPAFAQQWARDIEGFRKQYIADLLAEERHPIAHGDVRFIEFFKPDSTYRVVAEFTPSPGSTPFLLPTHSGKQKPFKEYGVVRFTLRDTSYTLHVYQSVNLVNNKSSNDLFLPFKDYTNYETTYGGGRYIDLSTTDIINGTLVIDFNKC